MNTWPQVDFDELLVKVKKPRVGINELTILGGHCAENCFEKFIGQWLEQREIKLPFRIWEYASEIIFKKENDSPENINVALLERGRLFGEDGDLTLRRNGSSFEWSFVGPAGIQAPEENYDAKCYWDENPKIKEFHQYQEKVLLWGKWDDRHKCWVEPRVAGAKLDYPRERSHQGEGKRLQLEYKIFSHAGQIKFVWYTDLSEWKEADHG